MATDKTDVLGPLLNDIGKILADTVGGDPNGVFLYVEIGDGWTDISVFKNEGDAVRWYDTKSTILSELLQEARYLESDMPNMRWSVLEYDVRGMTFDAKMKYPEEVDVEVMDDERREAALRARFGEKPVIYPPMADGAFELKL